MRGPWKEMAGKEFSKENDDQDHSVSSGPRLLNRNERMTPRWIWEISTPLNERRRAKDMILNFLRCRSVDISGRKIQCYDVDESVLSNDRISYVCTGWGKIWIQKWTDLGLFVHHNLAKSDLALFGCADRDLSENLNFFCYVLSEMVGNLRLRKWFFLAVSTLVTVGRLAPLYQIKAALLPFRASNGSGWPQVRIII